MTTDDLVYGAAFRVKIWYEDDGNQLAVSGNERMIGGGNIHIHR